MKYFYFDGVFLKIKPGVSDCSIVFGVKLVKVVKYFSLFF